MEVNLYSYNANGWLEVTQDKVLLEKDKASERDKIKQALTETFSQLDAFVGSVDVDIYTMITKSLTDFEAKDVAWTKELLLSIEVKLDNKWEYSQVSLLLLR